MMERAGAPVAGLDATETIPPLRDGAVEESPKWHRTGDVHDQSQGHQKWETETGEPHRRRSAVPPPLLIDEVHFPHHLVIAQIGIIHRHLRIMQRTIGQFAEPIEAGQGADAGRAKATLPVEDDDAGRRAFSGRGERGGGGVGRRVHVESAARRR